MNKKKEELYVGELVEGQILSEGKNGDGVLKHHTGMVIFVKGSHKGQYVRARVSTLATNFAIAEQMAEE